MKLVLFSLVIIGFCVLIRTDDSKHPDDEIVFKKLGSYRVSGSFNVKKTYWVPRHFKAQWQYARPICHAYGFDIVSLETLEEYEAVAEMCEKERDLFGSFVHVGGVAISKRSKTDWYWVSSRQTVSYNMTWQDGQPDNDNEWCLSLQKDGQFKFNDISCYGSWEEKFICQKIERIYEELDK
ncbi:C-type lectin domain family 4 member A-like [Bradysia coprophila]|uniref:C-type lectin domain family 4 member A-like n=1 Tax=Bradysia coprophila TaxID=38358 RepID=UPI00187DA3A1|nr:C-type lectin domain family 4 member A-like [Bradysia coprophila]